MQISQVYQIQRNLCQYLLNDTLDFSIFIRGLDHIFTRKTGTGASTARVSLEVYSFRMVVTVSSIINSFSNYINELIMLAYHGIPMPIGLGFPVSSGLNRHTQHVLVHQFIYCTSPCRETRLNLLSILVTEPRKYSMPCLRIQVDYISHIRHS